MHDSSSVIHVVALNKFSAYDEIGEKLMIKIIIHLISILGVIGICCIANLGLKLIVTHMICKHPELSNKKVKYITQMINKNIFNI